MRGKECGLFHSNSVFLRELWNRESAKDLECSWICRGRGSTVVQGSTVHWGSMGVHRCPLIFSPLGSASIQRSAVDHGSTWSARIWGSAGVFRCPRVYRDLPVSEGLRGSSGVHGSTGSSGVRGSTGFSGVRGSTGSSGVWGSAGVRDAAGGLQVSTGLQSSRSLRVHRRPKVPRVYKGLRVLGYAGNVYSPMGPWGFAGVWGSMHLPYSMGSSRRTSCSPGIWQQSCLAHSGGPHDGNFWAASICMVSCQQNHTSLGTIAARPALLQSPSQLLCSITFNNQHAGSSQTDVLYISNIIWTHSHKILWKKLLFPCLLWY